jgi:hypothetical protein
MGPADCEHVVSAVSHVGPHGVRANPEPADKYDLVVIGAGVAGLLSVIVAKVGTKPKKRMDRTDAEGGARAHEPARVTRMRVRPLSRARRFR